MPGITLRAPATAGPLREAFARVRDDLDVPAAFSRDVEAEADALATRGPRLPPGASSLSRVDCRDIPFVTIDPPGSRDLDQAFHAERRPGGFRVRYAIADVAAFVAPHSAVDRESFVRGVTLYLPDGRSPLLPDVLGEGAVSLLADEERPALLWTIDLDAEGEQQDAILERATIRSRAALGYPEVQAALAGGRAEEPIALLREIGTLRQQRERARGGVSLDLPTQEVVTEPGGGYALSYDAPLPVEQWNAQISLLAGMAAATIMVDARVGLLRTVPSPDPAVLKRLRHTARALHVPWPKGSSWTDIVRDLDRTRGDNAAFLVQAAHALRGAGYTALDAQNTADPTTVPIHSGVAAPYAHVTAPIRRLADRYANEIVLAHCAGDAPPGWAVAALPELVETMERATQHAAAVERAVIDTMECAALAGHVGETFTGVVVDRHRRDDVVQLATPAVVASVPARAALGAAIEVRLLAVDPIARHVEFVAV